MKNKIKKVKVVTFSEAITLFDELKKTGKTFRVDFIKKSTGKVRTIVGRFGVVKYLVNPANRKRKTYRKPSYLLTVFEWGNSYRSFSMDNILTIKKGDTLYTFNILNNYDLGDTPDKFGTYVLSKARAFPAITSVLFPQDSDPLGDALKEMTV